MTGHYTASPDDFLLDATPPLNANDKPRSFAGTFKLYSSTSTILGINFTYSSPYLAQRCLWMVVVFCGSCATGYHSY